MTLGDRIRSMTDDEIADLIVSAGADVNKHLDYLEEQCCLQCKYNSNGKCTIQPKSIPEEEAFNKKCPCISDFKGCIKQWLKKEV